MSERRRPMRATTGPRNVFAIRRAGVDDRLWTRLGTDGYHALRTLSWGQLTLVFLLIYLGLNAFFGLLLWVTDAAITGAEPGFWPRFYFSVQTMATIGYGGLSPDDWLSHAIVTLESFVGVVYTAVVTGVFYGKFSTPSARVAFSETCVVADIEGVPTLMFRCANARSTAIVEATVTFSLTREEVLADGETVRRIYDLPVRRRTSPMFGVSWVVYHPIDESSPMWGKGPEDFARERTMLIVTLTGIDDSLASSVHARHLWQADEIRFGYKFVDLFGTDADGQRFVDFSRIHEVKPAPLTLPGHPA
ncbi:MAG: hypothetical protein KC621_03060 [Myxococcales bacterium]|nr:hypothetical protein [Myxococcales bacterium]